MPDQHSAMRSWHAVDASQDLALLRYIGEWHDRGSAVLEFASAGGLLS